MRNGNIHSARIIEIRPSHGESGEIIDADIKLAVNDISFLCFVPDWREDHWSLDLKGTIINIEFSFLNLKIKPISLRKKKTIASERITGQIVEKKQLVLSDILDTTPDKADAERYVRTNERIFVDAGVIVSIIARKDKFKVGDWIEAEGRLDAHMVSKRMR